MAYPEDHGSPLDHLPDEAFQQLRAMSAAHSYDNRQSVFLKGDEATGMFAVESGRVRIVSNSSEGKEVILREIGPGGIFGEIAVLDGGERTADAVAVGATGLLYVSRGDFLAFLENNPKLCTGLLKVVCQRLRSTSEQLEDFSFLDLQTRLAKRLLQLAGEHGETRPEGTRIGLSLSQQTLAAMMGTSREAVNKQLRQWEDAGLVALGRNSISVVDREALEQLVEWSGN